MSTQLQYVPFSGMVVYQTQDSSGNDEYVFDSVVKFGSGNNATTITSDGVTTNYVYAQDIDGGNLSSDNTIRAHVIKANRFSGGSISENTTIKASNFSGSTIKASNFSGWDMSMIICGEPYVVSGVDLTLAGSGSASYTYKYLVLHDPNSVAGQTETEPESES